MACVYILTNPAIPGLLKIGYTADTAAERAADISRGTGVPAPFAVHWFMDTTTTDTAYAVEQAVHRTLANQRYNKAREYFTTPIAVAIDTIERTAYQHGAITNNLAVVARMLKEEHEAAKRAAAQRAANEVIRIEQHRVAAQRAAAQLAANEQAQREADARYQREAPQREAAAKQAALICAQREAAASAEVARVSRNKKIVWGSLALVACFLFGTYEDNKRQKEQERYIRAEQASAAHAERVQAARIKRMEAERVRAEIANAKSLYIKQACAPAQPTAAPAQAGPWGDVAQSRFAREYLPSRKMSISDFAALSFAEREKLANEYINARATTEKMDAAQRQKLEALRDKVVYADNGGRAPNQTGRTSSNWSDASAAMNKPTTYPSLSDAIAAIEQPTQDALLAAQHRRQQMEACNKALTMVSIGQLSSKQ